MFKSQIVTQSLHVSTCSLHWTEYYKHQETNKAKICM